MAYTKHWLTKAELKRMMKAQPELKTDFIIPKDVI